MAVEIVTEFSGFYIGTIKNGVGDVRKKLQRESRKDRKSMGRLCCCGIMLGTWHR